MTRNTSISLGDHFGAFIEQQISHGRYGSASEGRIGGENWGQSLIGGENWGRIGVRFQLFCLQPSSRAVLYVKLSCSPINTGVSSS